MRKYLFCDLDDTLLDTAVIFHDAARKNAHLIAEALSLDSSEVLAFGDQVDAVMTQVLGFSVHRFSHAWTRAYEILAGRHGAALEPAIVEEILSVSEGVHDSTPRVIDGAIAALQRAKDDGWKTVLWTAGDWWSQLNKILDVGIDDLLTDIRIVPVKTPEVLEKHLSDFEYDLCALVGNSARSDVTPSLAMGLWTIHIPADTWVYDEHPIDLDHPNYIRIPHISHLPAVLRGLVARQALGDAVS